MIRSMTGFGRGAAEAPPVRYEVEIRGVNHRFLEIRVRIPEEILHREAEIRSRVAGVARRGRIDVNVARSRSGDIAADVSVNRKVIAGYLAAAGSVSQEFRLPAELSLPVLLSLPGVVKVDYPPEGETPGEEDALYAALAAALDAFHRTRAAEGERLGRDLRERIDRIEGEVAEMDRRAAGVPAELAKKVRQKVSQLLEAVPVDETRLAQEVAHLASRSDVTEEIVRLRGHLQQARSRLEGNDAEAGKAMDFLVQEMHRETNTVGAKSESLAVVQCVLRIKSEIEKVREQVQNLE
jgi:uncharacterized protein (TIGR00255 family)